MRIYYKITFRCYPIVNVMKIAISVAVSSMIAHSDFYQKNIEIEPKLLKTENLCY